MIIAIRHSTNYTTYSLYTKNRFSYCCTKSEEQCYSINRSLANYNAKHAYFGVFRMYTYYEHS